jgi:hypothetical protein
MNTFFSNQVKDNMFALRETVLALNYFRAVFAQFRVVVASQSVSRLLSGRFYVGIYPVAARYIGRCLSSYPELLW